MSISQQSQNAIKTFLSDHLSGKKLGGHFMFRRVSYVDIFGEPIYSKVIIPTEEPETLSYFDYTDPQNTKLLERNIQIDRARFYGITSKAIMRAEMPAFRGKEIFFDDSTYRNLNVSGLTFQLEHAKPIVPVVGDLLCIFFSNDSCKKRYGREDPYADAWFIASEQFLRAWTAILFDKHEALTKIVPKSTKPEDFESALKSKLFCGNTLMTNTWLKNKLAYENENILFSREESINFYWHLRIENVAKYWVDVWASLVLLSRYGELPTCQNVPNLKNTTGRFEPQRAEWNLPHQFIEKLFAKCGCVMPTPPKIETPSIEKETPKVETPKKKAAIEIVFEINWNDC
jgi:hypothetical protein